MKSRVAAWMKRRSVVGPFGSVVLAAALVHCSQAASPIAGLAGGSNTVTCNPACKSGETCTAAGHCEPTSGAGGSGSSTGGSSSGGTDSGGTAAGGKPVIVPVTDAGTDAPEPEEGDACADVEFAVTNVVPTVALLIDRSASMSEEDLDAANPGVSRWDALKTALLDPAGAIGLLQDQVRFGVVFYAGGSGRGAECPVLDEGGDPATLMPPRTGLLADFTTYFQPLDTLPDTPTGESVAFTAGELAAVTDVGPKYIVLATDGEPDLCDDRQEPSGRDRSLAEVTAAYEAGISTFVISVGTDVAEAHLSEIANAGQGFPPTDMPAMPRFYQVTTQQALADAFEQIITGTRSCTLMLNGEIDPKLADKGKVALDGQPIPKDDTNGWRVVDGSTIELVGSACEAIQDGMHSLTASFPCEVIVHPPR